MSDETEQAENWWDAFLSFGPELAALDSFLAIVLSIAAIVGFAWAVVWGLSRFLRKRIVPEPKTPPPMLGDLSTNREILGRAEKLDELGRALTHNGKAAIVKGQGGIGKSALAREFARTHKDTYDGVLWVDAETKAGLIAGLLRLSAQIALAGDGGVTDEAKARSYLDALPTEGRWLVIYDNVEAEEKLKSWWPPEGVDLIITSRMGGWSGGVMEVEPDKLPCARAEDAGPQLLMAEARVFDDADGALALAQRLDGLPLALVVAGGLVKAGQSYGEVTADIGTVLEQAETLDHGGSVQAVVQLSYDRLSADARAVLDLFAWFAPEGLEARLLTDVPESWLWEKSPIHLEPTGEDSLALCQDPARVSGALRELVGRSLLSREGDHYALHRLTAEAVRGLQGDRAEAAMGEAVAVLAAAYPQGQRGPANSVSWPDCRRLTPHVLAYRAATGDQAPALAAVHYLYNQASIFLGEQAQFAPALDLARDALRLREARLGEGALDIAIGYSMLGGALELAKEFEAAVAAQRRAVALGETHDHGVQDLTVWLNNLSQALKSLGLARGDRAALEEALSVDERALALRRAHFGGAQGDAPHEAIAMSLSNLAGSHAALGNGAEAIRFGRAALEMRRKVLSPEDVRLGFSLNNLGSSLLKAGQAREAAALLEEALAIRSQHLAADHPHVVNTASFLVSARIKLGEVRSARDLAKHYGLDWETRLQMAAQLPDPVD